MGIRSAGSKRYVAQHLPIDSTTICLVSWNRATLPITCTGYPIAVTGVGGGGGGIGDVASHFDV
jgi:hypothetical protein